LKTENTILRDKLGKRRIILTDEQKRFLAVSGKKLGRKVLSEICCAFSPDTILKWHRKLIAAKYDGSGNRTSGRPRIS
jgi:putative transposase